MFHLPKNQWTLAFAQTELPKTVTPVDIKVPYPVATAFDKAKPFWNWDWRIAEANFGPQIQLAQISEQHFGRTSAHSFWVVMDPNNKVVAELHAFAHDPKTGETSVFPPTYEFLASGFSTWHSLPGPKKGAPLIRFAVYTDPSEMFTTRKPEETSIGPCARASRATILYYYREQLKRAQRIDLLDEPYHAANPRRLASNSNSGAFALGQVIPGLDLHPYHLKYEAPGANQRIFLPPQSHPGRFESGFEVFSIEEAKDEIRKLTGELTLKGSPQAQLDWLQTTSAHGAFDEAMTEIAYNVLGRAPRPTIVRTQIPFTDLAVAQK